MFEAVPVQAHTVTVRSELERAKLIKNNMYEVAKDQSRRNIVLAYI